MGYWQTVVGMMQVYVPSIGLFFLGGILGHDVADRLGISLRAEWTRWMTTLYLFSLLIPLPLWVEGSLFYGRLWLVYALLSLAIGIARGLAFPAREQLQKQLQQKVEHAQQAIEQSLQQHREEQKQVVPRNFAVEAGTRVRHV